MTTKAMVLLTTGLLGRLGYRVTGHTDPVEALADFRKRTARTIAAQLGEAGLSINVRVLPSATFKKQVEDRSDLFLYRWIVGPEAGEALENSFHTKDAARRLGLHNRTGYSSPEFDAAIEEALRAGDPTTRVRLLQRAIQVLDREVPWIPLFTIRWSQERSLTSSTGFVVRS